MMPVVAAPVTDPIEWFTNLYAGCDGWLTLFSVDRTTGEQQTDWAPIGQADQLARVAEELSATCCVWFGVATRKEHLGKRRGGGDDCLHIPALWADIDVEGPNHKGGHPLPATLEAARLIIEEFPLRPSAVIRSGGGLQPWWFLTEPIGVSEARELLRGWGATWAELGRRHGWHVDNVFDVARVMRLPGTWNRKTQPTLVTGKVCWDRRYNPSDFEPHLLDPPPAPEPGRIPYIGPERPGDAFNAVRRGSDILAAAGFTLARTDRSGEEHWTRPGKATKDGASATVYPDGHTTLWSDTIQAQWPHADLRRPYDPFGLFTVFFCAGDFTIARQTLSSQGYGTRARADDDFSWVQLNGTPKEPLADNTRVPAISPIHWPDFWKREHTGEDWLIEPIVPRGRQVALWATHKTGKSLITLEMAAAAATGHPCLGNPARPPIDVIYLDFEMTEDDLHERLDSLGYGPDTDLDRLHYYLLPALPPLDSEPGASTLLELVSYHRAQLVVIDTMARVVTGEENSADTYRAFYRYTGTRLKALNVSLLRLDHAGKDPGQGQRGSSAKGDDVDLVWQLAATDSGLELSRRASRIFWIPPKIALRRHDEIDDLHHTISLVGAWPAGTKDMADQLDDLAVPLGATRREARLILASNQRTATNEVLGAALKYRRQRPLEGLIQK